jgi:outer membrane protein assembly factor BamB
VQEILVAVHRQGARKRAVPGEEPWGALRALDPLTGDVKWEFRVTTPPWCGLLSTAGGLVFSGTIEGMFFAVDAESGKPLWRFQTGGAIWSNPISYQAGGHQYVAIAAATRSWCSGCRRSRTARPARLFMIHHAEADKIRIIDSASGSDQPSTL